MVGHNIRRIRHELKIPQWRLARWLNVANKTLGNWECGNKVPSEKVLRNIADYFGIPVSYLTDDNPSPRLTKPIRPMDETELHLTIEEKRFVLQFRRAREDEREVVRYILFPK